MRSSFLLLFIGVVGCGGDAYHEGAICPAPEVLDAFMPGDDLAVKVVMDSCISACARDVEARCEVDVSALPEIALEVEGSWQRPVGLGCAAVCSELAATCTIPDLAAGTYTLKSGDHTLELVVPAGERPTYEDDCGYPSP